jgi:hypothetical protein
MSGEGLRALLRGHTIIFDKVEDETGIFDQADAFVHLSQGNETVQYVLLLPFTDRGDDASGNHRYAIWEKVAKGIGNLKALRKISIYSASAHGEESLLAADWEILACILRRLQRGIQLDVEGAALLLWDIVRYPEALPGLAGVIRGKTMIKGFCTGYRFPFDCLETLCSILLTLPALENVTFQHITGQDTDEGQSCEAWTSCYSHLFYEKSRSNVSLSPTPYPKL